MDGFQQLVAPSVFHEEVKINFHMLMVLIDDNIHNKYPLEKFCSTSMRQRGQEC